MTKKYYRETYKLLDRMGVEVVQTTQQGTCNGHRTVHCRWKGKPFTVGMSSTPISNDSGLKAIRDAVRRAVKRIEQEGTTA